MTLRDSSLNGKSLITTQDISRDEIMEIVELAEEMQQDRYSDKYNSVLQDRSFLMFFYNPSVRTRQSFEIAATELGGHGLYIEPGSMRLESLDEDAEKQGGETIEDVAGVMNRYGTGVGIRMLEDKIDYYGRGDEVLREYDKYLDKPLVSFAHDRFHPCQGLADVMGYRKHFDKDLEDLTIAHVWGHGALARSHCSVQESMLISSRLGMNVRTAYPKGYALDEEVVSWTRENCKENGTSFDISHDPVDVYEDADIVYSRNWMSEDAYQDGEFKKEQEIEKAMQYTDWICDEEKMKLTDDGVFSHPMPVDRTHEATDEVASGPRSIILDIAENRLHVQKAYMALSMG